MLNILRFYDSIFLAYMLHYFQKGKNMKLLAWKKSNALNIVKQKCFENSLMVLIIEHKRKYLFFNF